MQKNDYNAPDTFSGVDKIYSNVPTWRDVQPLEPVALSDDPLIQAFQIPGYMNKWSSGGGEVTEITFSFYSGDMDTVNTHVYSTSFADRVFSADFLTFTEGQKELFREALQAWEAVANIKFIEVDEVDGAAGTIRVFGSNADSGPAIATTLLPTKYISGGDIWLFEGIMESDWTRGEASAFRTIMHEIGHALGLNHTHDDIELPHELDYRNYSIMSYNDPAGAWMQPNGKGDWIYTASNTPMVYDIQAIQYMYGANTDTNSDNTIYTFHPSSPKIEAIWDGGGVDLIDLSAFNTSNRVDLTPGAYSTLGFTGAIKASSIRLEGTGVDNLGISFGSVVENVIGGKATDRVFGNAANNEIAGMAGNDTLFGKGGADVLLGGRGRDLLKGGAGNDELSGGIGKDKMAGGKGDDTLIHIGGDDVMHGGAGADRFVFEGGGSVIVRDFDAGEGDELIVATELLSGVRVYEQGRAVMIESENLTIKLCNSNLSATDVEEML